MGASLAHWVARNHPHQFSLTELLPWANLGIEYRYPPVEWHSGYAADTVCNENEDYAQKRRLYHYGGTVAHIMAREGHQFLAAEIEQLGNPLDGYGLTIGAWQTDPAACLTAVDSKMVKYLQQREFLPEKIKNWKC